MKIFNNKEFANSIANEAFNDFIKNILGRKNLK